MVNCIVSAFRWSRRHDSIPNSLEQYLWELARRWLRFLEFVTLRKVYGPSIRQPFQPVHLYSGQRSCSFGYSSGDAIKAIPKRASQTFANGFWLWISFNTSGNWVQQQYGFDLRTPFAVVLFIWSWVHSMKVTYCCHCPLFFFPVPFGLAVAFAFTKIFWARRITFTCRFHWSCWSVCWQRCDLDCAVCHWTTSGRNGKGGAPS